MWACKSESEGGAKKRVGEEPLEKGIPTAVFLPGEAHGQRRLVGYNPWGCKELDMTKQLTFSLSHGL